MVYSAWYTGGVSPSVFIIRMEQYQVGFHTNSHQGIYAFFHQIEKSRIETGIIPFVHFFAVFIGSQLLYFEREIERFRIILVKILNEEKHPHLVEARFLKRTDSLLGIITFDMCPIVRCSPYRIITGTISIFKMNHISYLYGAVIATTCLNTFKPASQPVQFSDGAMGNKGPFPRFHRHKPNFERIIPRIESRNGHSCIYMSKSGRKRQVKRITFHLNFTCKLITVPLLHSYLCSSSKKEH